MTLQASSTTFRSISLREAADFGVEEGTVPSADAAAQAFLRKWLQQDRWCAPLVLAGPSEVFDFTKGYDADRTLRYLYGIGRYDEDRVGMYETSLFKNGEEPRTVHVGLDIGAPEGTPVFAPVEATLWDADVLTAPGDYGGAIILKTSSPEGSDLFMLFGHLSHVSVERWKRRRAQPGGENISIVKGELLGWLGGRSENGGWNPHLHWQLSWLRPSRCDLPGAVTKKNRAFARLLFPDPTDLFRLAIAGWS